MANSTAGALKRPVPPAIIAIAVIVALAFIGYLAYANLAAPPKALPLSKQAQTNHDWIKSLAQKSGGDITKLNDEERGKLMKMTNGYGAQALKATLKE